MASGYERVDRVEDRGQFATRGDILDVFPATGDNAVRVEFFDIEIESIRRFSTFTQRSLEDVERSRSNRPTELAAEYREDADARRSQTSDEGDDSHPADIASCCRSTASTTLLDLAPDDAWLAVAGREDVESALDELWSDVEATYHDATGHGLYVRPTNCSNRSNAGAARLTISNLTGRAAAAAELRAEHPASMARSFEAAEIEVEKLQRSGYRTIIAWSRKSSSSARSTTSPASRRATARRVGRASASGTGVFFTRSRRCARASSRRR